MGGSGRRSVLGAEAAAGPHRFGGTRATARSVWPYGVPYSRVGGGGELRWQMKPAPTGAHLHVDPRTECTNVPFVPAESHTARNGYISGP
nr:unnamed protein product [Digitaria exilis]